MYKAHVGICISMQKYMHVICHILAFKHGIVYRLLLSNDLWVIRAPVILLL